MGSVWNCLEVLSRESQKPEAEIIALAIETGLRQLWRERMLGRYLRGEVSREDAVEAAGAEWVDLAERQHQAAKEDLAWALER
jgi:hypothetical protein